MVRLAGVLGVLAVFTAAALGCASATKEQKPVCDPHDLSGCVIDQVAIVGDNSIPESDIEARLATAETSRVLGGVLEHIPILSLIDGLTVEYERFDRFVLERDLARVERYYRARGFYEAHARAGRAIPLPNGHVRIEIVVDEGVPVVVGDVELTWKDWRPSEETRDVTKAVTDAKNELKLGSRFDEDRYEALKKRLVRVMTERGFAYGAAEGKASVDLVTHTAKIVFSLELGPPCTFGEIKIAGLHEIPENAVRTAIGIAPGDPFSTAKLDAAEYALAEFGVFNTIEIAPKLAATKPKDPVIPVTFTVTEGQLRALSIGGGIELGSRVEAHVVTGWENRNFLGGLRRLSVQVRGGLVFWPNQIQKPFITPTEILPEIRTSVEFRQPGFLEKRTNFLFSGAFFVYCPLINCLPPKDPDPTEPLIGYRQYSGRTGLERSFLQGQYDIGQYVNVQLYDPFSYNQNQTPPGYGRVLIPYLETIATVDLRRGEGGKPDRIDPHSGAFLTTNVQVAALGDAHDVKIKPELRAFLPVSKHATLAFRLTTGLLFPSNYGGTLQSSTEPTSDEVAGRARDLQIVRLRGFFSGGQSSNRGYSYNQIGPSAPTDLIYPPTPAQQKARELLHQSRADVAMYPVGGYTLWESSLELRIPFGPKLGTAIFLDGSDVTRQVTELRLNHPHLSAGLGLRYATPVGPLRFDVGYRIPGLQILGTTTIDACSVGCPKVVADEQPASTIFGLPIAVALTIGEAF